MGQMYTMKLAPMPEPLSEIAPRLGMSEPEASEKLEELAKEGSIMRVRAGEQALVLSPGNSKEIMNICLCCGCCCGFMSILKHFDRPADHCASPYEAKIDPDLCVLCGTCEERCQMEAIHEGGQGYEVEEARCIGCGLCVPTCPEEAVSMVERPKAPAIPVDMLDMNMKIAQERGVT